MLFVWVYTCKIVCSVNLNQVTMLKIRRNESKHFLIVLKFMYACMCLWNGVSYSNFQQLNKVKS